MMPVTAAGIRRLRRAPCCVTCRASPRNACPGLRSRARMSTRRRAHQFVVPHGRRLVVDAVDDDDRVIGRDLRVEQVAEPDRRSYS